MPVSIESSLRHVAWAEKEFFSRLAQLPVDLYTATYHDPEWNVAHIASHIASGAAWYELCLTGVNYEQDVPAAPANAEEMVALGEFLAARTAAIVHEARHDDALLHVAVYGEEFDVLRSTLLVQAIHHSVEHRAHIASALEASGYHDLDLESLDAWAYAAATR